MATNLPNRSVDDSAANTKLYFDTYGQLPLEFSAIDVNTAVGFFTNKGFSDESALTVSAVLLKQAKLDETPITAILDTISGYDNASLSQLVTEILNNNRTKISTLGYRAEPVQPKQISRNISA